MIPVIFALAALLRLDARAAPEKPIAPAPTQIGPGGFDRVLADPDNLERNFAYVRRRVDEGDLRAAMIGLERMLMVDPNQHQVRLYYAGILVRLGLIDDAQFELEILKPQDLPPESKAKIRDLEDAIFRQRRKLHLGASLTTAFDFDHNRNAAPSSGERLVFGAPTRVTGANQKTEDFAFLGIANVKASYDVGRRKHQVFASLTYLRTEQQVVDNLDLQVYAAQYGGTLKTRWVDVTPFGLFDHVRLRQQTFLRTNGGGLRVQRLLTEKLSASLEGRGAYQEYNRTRELAAGPERSGRQVDFLAGLGWELRPNLLLSFNYTWTQKEAVRRYNAYDANAVGAAGLWTFGRGLFLASSVNYAYFSYDQADPLVGPKARFDYILRWRTTFGIPLSVFTPALRDFLVTQAYEYFHSESNLPNFSYDNNKVSGAITYRWEL